jgi:hypothetical protein
MWVLRDDLFGNAMVRLSFQPSLSLLDAPHPAFRETPAFLLQAAGVVVHNGWLCVVSVSPEKRWLCLLT